MNGRYKIKIVTYNTSDYRAVVALRNRILRKPLGLVFTKKDLEIDKNEVIFGVFNNDIVLGCVQLRKADNASVKLRQMAVYTQYQQKNIGTMLLLYVEQYAQKNNYNNITLHARVNAIDFYKKSGYSTRGKIFTEVGIPHQLMVKSL